MSSLDGNGTAQRGKAYWRSLDDLADTPRFRRFVEREFPAFAEKMLEPTSRRSFLKVMGASMALAGMTGCRWPSEEILPFTQRPEGYSPGMPMQYATAMDLGGSATGLLVTSYDGRPVKIEGNPLHPQSRGVSGPLAQASLLELYDPDRSQHVVRSEGGRRTNVEWTDFESFAGGKFAELRAGGGAGLRVLAGADSSPSLAEMRSRLAAAFPQAGWVEYEPLSRDNERAGTELLFGTAHRVHPALAEADLIVSFDEDFLQQHPTAVRNAGEWIQGRNAENGRFSRLVVFESHFSITGAAADQRIPLDASQIPFAAGCLAAELFLGQGVPLPAEASALRPWLERFRSHPRVRARRSGAAAELAHHRGHGLVLAGPRQPPAVHALVQLINVALDNAGTDRALHGRHGSGPPPPRRGDPPAGDGDQGRAGGHAGDPRRQPGLRRARRPGLRGTARVGGDVDPPGRLRQRNFPAPADGTCLAPTTWRRGATHAPTTAPTASRSR